MKITIEIEEGAHGLRSVDYTVRRGNQFAEGLTFEEMLGLVASITMPPKRNCLSWLKTQAQWDEQTKQLQAMRERRDSEHSGCDVNQHPPDRKVLDSKVDEVSRQLDLVSRSAARIADNDYGSNIDAMQKKQQDIHAIAHRLSAIANSMLDMEVNISPTPISGLRQLAKAITAEKKQSKADRCDVCDGHGYIVDEWITGRDPRSTCPECEGKCTAQAESHCENDDAEWITRKWLSTICDTYDMQGFFFSGTRLCIYRIDDSEESGWQLVDAQSLSKTSWLVWTRGELRNALRTLGVTLNESPQLPKQDDGDESITMRWLSTWCEFDRHDRAAVPGTNYLVGYRGQETGGFEIVRYHSGAMEVVCRNLYERWKLIAAFSNLGVDVKPLVEQAEARHYRKPPLNMNQSIAICGSFGTIYEERSN